MKQDRAKAITERLLRAFGLHGWSVRFVDFPPMPDETKVLLDGSTWTRPRRRLGLCSYRNMTISLSIQHVEQDSDAEVLRTVCEEVAHAATPGALHGPRWQKMNVRIQQILIDDGVMPVSPMWYVRNPAALSAARPSRR